MSDGRRTISRPVTLEGIGLHLGQPCRLTFHPAPPRSGVAFHRSDLEDRARTLARVEHAILAERRTQLGKGREAIHTCEHVLSAVAGAEIDDVLIEMDAPEPPIIDGSAAPFLDALESADPIAQEGVVEFLDVVEPIRVVDGESVYEARPASSLELEVLIDFPHPLIGRQHGRWTVTRRSYARELAPARTFGFLHEVEMLRSRGLIQGASLENAVVLDDHGVVGTTLRWPDEFVRHKAADCVGDLALAGRRVRAHIVAERPSHRGTVMLVRELAAALARR